MGSRVLVEGILGVGYLGWGIQKGLGYPEGGVVSRLG